MRGCHRCEHAKAIGAKAYAETPWEKTPCATCPDFSYDTAMEYDDEREERDGGGVEVGLEEQCADVAMSEVLPVSVMADLVRALMSLNAPLRTAVCMRYQGYSYPEIARAEGITMAAAEARHRRALTMWPALQSLFVEKMAKQRRRKRSEKSGTGKI